ncbi:MAG: hypothetical protein IPI35_19370 [Deltaproteobacteria bacterium]|nr:hypothetical protein [Deltaproteobacteria bacterium]
MTPERSPRSVSTIACFAARWVLSGISCSEHPPHKVNKAQRGATASGGACTSAPRRAWMTPAFFWKGWAMTTAPGGAPRTTTGSPSFWPQPRLPGRRAVIWTAKGSMRRCRRLIQPR